MTDEKGDERPIMDAHGPVNEALYMEGGQPSPPPLSELKPVVNRVLNESRD
jgi:hypothetical protein